MAGTIRKVLVANRGEIACRIIRTCRKLGIKTVAVYSDADKNSMHVSLADESQPVGPSAARDSYLRADRMIEAARLAGADAIHPGYGFLSENPDFARAVIEAGLILIGPTPQTIEDMGDKERARMLAKGAGVPVLIGSARITPYNLQGLSDTAAEVGYPLLVKAAAGGGGIGMRRIDQPAELEKTVHATQEFAAKAFGDSGIYLERYIESARHIEIQVFGFGDGRAVHLFERECSIQRRFQKIIEESPAPRLDESARDAMAAAAIALVRQQRFAGAGTVEFVVDSSGNFYFLEMNTRIQVEHPVTEMITGLDLVELQIRLAGKDPLSALTQNSIMAAGHALECRIYAEDPSRNFMPSPGPLTVFKVPNPAPGIRIDTGFCEGDAITYYYDPMIAKVIVHGPSREAALSKMRAALDEFQIEGVKTNLGLLRKMLVHPEFRAGNTFTRFVDTYMTELLAN
jgi:3-methylcrotonyl-CoA carboxylase alpha subunit